MPRLRRWAVVGIVAVAGLLAAAAYLEHRTTARSGIVSPPIRITGAVSAVEYVFDGTPECWRPRSSPGVEWGDGTAAWAASTWLSNNGSLGRTPECVASSVRITTAGFSLIGSNVPVEVAPGGASELNVSIQTPADFYGIVTVAVTQGTILEGAPA